MASPLQLQHRFSIKLAPPCEYLEIRDNLNRWKRIADEKRNKINAQPLDEFHYCSKVSAITAERLTVSSNYSTYHCRDDKGQIQAVALTQERVFHSFKSDRREKYLVINTLVSHPHNLRHAVNKGEPGRVKGAATALMHHLFEQALQDPVIEGIKVDAYNPAKTFYENFGFVSDSEQPSTAVSSGLVLTADRIRQLNLLQT